jgi:hypothetical protein
LTSGDLWEGFSPIGLPGAATRTWTNTVTLCLSSVPGAQGGCTTTTTNGDAVSCSWLPALSCGDSDFSSGTLGPYTLAMGQCVHLTVVRSAHVDAHAPDGLPPLASVSWDIHGQADGEQCLVDNGR